MRKGEVFHTVFKNGDGVLFIVALLALSQGLARGQILGHTG